MPARPARQRRQRFRERSLASNNGVPIIRIPEVTVWAHAEGMNTSTIGLLAVVGSLLVACGGSVEPAGGNGAGGDGEGGEAPVGGEASGGAGTGGLGEGGAGEGEGGANDGGANVGGANVGGAGEGGGPSDVCALMDLVTISDPQLFDAGGDLVWSPGETATFTVLLTNEADEDNFNYPGVQVASPLFGIEGGNNTLFGIFAGEATEVTVSVSASDAFQSGSEVELVFHVTTLSEGCGELDSVGLTVTLE
jgi:hypothetical protein